MPLISVRGLTKLYRMGDSIVRALDGVDLEIEQGEFVAISGPSGSGKSTMMHLLGCLDRPTSGAYTFNGRDVGGLSDRQLAEIRNRQIGFVFQTFNLINRTTALENVAVPLFYARKTNSRGPARKALEHVGLANRAHHRSNELSGGERQRVAIARAIVSNPLLLLADEPTGNLDSRTGQQIMDAFRALNEQGVTVVIVTHEYDVAVHARRIVQMRDGRIISDRATEEIISQGPGTGLQARARTGFSEEEGGVLVGAQAGSGNATDDPIDLGPPKLARGANLALWVGLIAPLMMLAAALAGTFTRPPPQLRLDEVPPVSVLLKMMAGSFASLAAIVLGIIAIVTGRRVLRRMRQEPGNWRGVRRARAAMVLGWVAVVGPFVVGLAASIPSGQRSGGR